MNSKIPQRVWSEAWTGVDAVRFLVLDGEKLRGDKTLASRFNPLMSQWFMGQDAPLLSDERLRVLTPNLLQTLSRLRAKMQEVGLDHSSQLPSGLWVRFFCKHDIAIQPIALIEFAWWQYSNEVRGEYFLYKYRNDDGNYIGCKHKPSGKRGRTAIEIAFDDLPTALASKEYVAQWRVSRIISKPQPVHASGQRASSNALQKRTAQQLRLEESNDSDGLEATKSKKRRNINEVKSKYGTHCFDTVKEALADLAERKNSQVSLRSIDGRPYSTALSLSELTSVLKRKDKSVSRYADSTLTPVLRYFVSAPRGRPSPLADRPPSKHNSTNDRAQKALPRRPR